MRHRKAFGLFLFLSLLILLLDQAGWLTTLKIKLSSLTAGWREKTYQKIVRPLGKEERLRNQLASCEAEKLVLEEENLRLRKLLGAGVKPETQFALARVVAASQTHLLVVLFNAIGVKSGASVVKEKIFLGRIERREGNEARVLLLTSPQLKVPVKIWPHQRAAERGESSLAQGILTAQGGSLIVAEILASEKIAPGNWVGTVVESGDFFLIGPIKKVYPSKDKVFQQAEVEWLIKPRQLLTVAIIKNN